MKKQASFIERLSYYFWDENERARMREEMGKKAFAELDFRREACYAFVCCHLRECENIWKKEN